MLRKPHRSGQMFWESVQPRHRLHLTKAVRTKFTAPARWNYGKLPAWHMELPLIRTERMVKPAERPILIPSIRTSGHPGRRHNSSVSPAHRVLQVPAALRAVLQAPAAALRAARPAPAAVYVIPSQLMTL